MVVKRTYRHKGLSLTMHFKQNSFYVRTPLEGGKTLYQLLLERLVEGRVFNISAMARRLCRHAPTLNDRIINNAMARIEAAAKRSTDKRLRRMRFKRMQKGGTQKRIHPVARSPDAMKVVEATVMEICKAARSPEPGDVLRACKARLALAGFEGITLKQATVVGVLERVASRRRQQPRMKGPKPRVKRGRLH